MKLLIGALLTFGIVVMVSCSSSKKCSDYNNMYELNNDECLALNMAIGQSVNGVTNNEFYLLNFETSIELLGENNIAGYFQGEFKPDQGFIKKFAEQNNTKARIPDDCFGDNKSIKLHKENSAMPKPEESGAKGNISVSRPVISDDGNFMLIYISVYKGPLAGSGKILFLEKTMGAWLIKNTGLVWMS